MTLSFRDVYYFTGPGVRWCGDIRYRPGWRIVDVPGDGVGGCISAGTRGSSKYSQYSFDQGSDGNYWGGLSFTPGFGIYAGMTASYEVF
jgi:hypothetical protein